MGVPVACAKTGVKHLHKMAEELFDVGVYFEANGHGTVIFKDCVKAQVRSKAAEGHPGAKTLANFIDLTNETVGDAASIFLLVEVQFPVDGGLSKKKKNEKVTSQQNK
jgi:phosphoacetylglucosamine mutase